MAFGFRVDVAVVAANHVFDMPPVRFGCPERPCLALWIGEEGGELGAVRAAAGDRAGPGEIRRGRERLGETPVQMFDAGRNEAGGRCPALQSAGPRCELY